jgi:hypothetical protein
MPAAAAELMPQPGQTHAGQQQRADAVGGRFLLQHRGLAGDLDAFAQGADGLL